MITKAHSAQPAWPRVSIINSLLALRRVRLARGEAMGQVYFTEDGVRLLREEVQRLMSFHVEVLDLGEGHAMVCLGMTIRGGRG